MPKNFYTVKEVAAILKVSTNTVYKYLGDGTIVATRLGDEGRFKIPVSEVARLQGNPVIENPTPPSPETSPETAVASPQLFDWLLSLTVLFAAVSNLSNPIKNPDLSVAPIAAVFSAFQVVSLLCASLLFLLEMFGADGRKIISFVTRSLLTFSCLVTALLFFHASEPWSASYYLAFALGGVISQLLDKASSESKTILYAGLLVIVTAAGFAQKPEAFIFADVRYYVTHNVSAFLLMVASGTVALMAMLLFAYKRSRVLYPIFTTIIGLAFLILTVNFITSQSWIKTISCLFLGSFFLVLPISNEIDSFARLTRRQLILSFAWVAAVLGLGIIGIKCVQGYTLTLIDNTATVKAQTAAATANQIVTDATNSLVRLSKDPALTKAPIATSSAELLRDRSRAVYFSTSVFRRVFFITPSSQSLAEYPAVLTAPSSLATSDYVVKVEAIRKPVISQVVTTTGSLTGLVPTIFIAVPILSPTGEYLGALGGALDPGLLQDRLNLGAQSAGSEIAVQDDAGNFLFGKGHAHPAGTKNHLDFNSEGKLVYQSIAEVPSINWTVTLSQLYDVAFRESSLLSSAVFFICAVIGIGSLLLNMHLRLYRTPNKPT